jgi:hypothetical protein
MILLGLFFNPEDAVVEDIVFQQTTCYQKSDILEECHLLKHMPFGSCKNRRFKGTSVLTRATWCNVPEETVTTVKI